MHKASPQYVLWHACGGPLSDRKPCHSIHNNAWAWLHSYMPNPCHHHHDHQMLCLVCHGAPHPHLLLVCLRPPETPDLPAIPRESIGMCGLPRIYSMKNAWEPSLYNVQNNKIRVASLIQLWDLGLQGMVIKGTGGQLISNGDSPWDKVPEYCSETQN